tara:strand:- start:4803 stop:5747 length:945 start_codon:yes stop_codon:yes gene_type:complete
MASNQDRIRWAHAQQQRAKNLLNKSEALGEFTGYGTMSQDAAQQLNNTIYANKGYQDGDPWYDMNTPLGESEDFIEVANPEVDGNVQTYPYKQEVDNISQSTINPYEQYMSAAENEFKGLVPNQSKNIDEKTSGKLDLIKKVMNNVIPSAEAGEIDDSLDFIKRKYNKLTGTSDDYAQQAQEHLASKGLSKEAIAGIMGNIAVETSDSFDHTQKQSNDGNGYGLFQLDFLKPFYNTWLKENSLEDSSTSQIDFMYDTIYGNSQDLIGEKNAKKLRDSFESGDYKKITKDFMKIWENPGKPQIVRRLRSAEKFSK